MNISYPKATLKNEIISMIKHTPKLLYTLSTDRLKQLEKIYDEEILNIDMEILKLKKKLK